MIQPREIYEELSRTVVGQDEALREVSVALVKHLVGHRAGNILLIGNSGTGKTTVCDELQRRGLGGRLGGRVDPLQLRLGAGGGQRGQEEQPEDDGKGKEKDKGRDKKDDEDDGD